MLVGLNGLNWLCAIGFLVLVGVMTIRPDLIADRFGPHTVAVVRFAQATVAIGTIAAVAAHVIFTRLVAMIDTARAGAPFSRRNAARLKTIAWALLATQVLDLGFGLVVGGMQDAVGMPLPWSFGLTGWLAVLMLFVLARMFAHGAAMQDELAATV
jgi:hypothetical protein